MPAFRPDDGAAAVPGDDAAARPGDDAAARPGDDAAGRPGDDAAARPGGDAAARSSDDAVARSGDDPEVGSAAAAGPVLSGILLAAGAGSRMGTPKALVADDEGPWLERAVQLLLAGGCGQVVVVLGAAAYDARLLVPPDPRVDVVVARRWALGLGESLRAGLARARGTAAVVTLVDLPGMPVEVLHRLLTGGGATPVDAHTLRQAVYGGRPGHPVVIGRDHWLPLARSLQGDRGARPYLVQHGVLEVECADLHHGQDVDA